MILRDYQVGNVNRRQAGWIAVAVTAIILLAFSLVAVGMAQIGGGVANASPERPIDMARALVAAQATPLESVHPEEPEPALTGVPAGDFHVNLNTADASQLAQVPGLGKVKVKAIVAWRTIHPFMFTADIMKVKGIGKGSYEKLKPFLAVDGPPMQGVPPKGVSPRQTRATGEPKTRTKLRAS